ncbi:hypothetical protein CAPTEDRAFT_211381 [Capitella teleta]|uniref:Uncharacterized protein n=1 Tax=Capitella teleta TaxID=283909 RepID=R7U9S4_CAPTE|nr:hypothetical protein CAPTEDRAFT_211381 [Capitella teleta]|eukprot:ELU00558.1 hypothetical protein CAPTEDRAFT_211381 [Capitella teleta]
MVKCLRMTGTKLVSDCDNSKAARKFINELAQSICHKLTKKLGSCFFSILTDGSQPKKTGAEKEMVMFRRSGKLKRQFKELAKVNASPKVYGTCFINHMRKELTNLLNNWGAADKVVSMMPSMIESVKKCIQTRSKLDETMEEVFRAMTWLDPANWCDTDEEVRMMNLVYERLKVPPHKAGFSVASLKRRENWLKIDFESLFDAPKMIPMPGPHKEYHR